MEQGAQQAVLEAKQALADAEVKAKEAKRQQAERDLAAVRREGRRLIKELDSLRRTVKNAEAEAAKDGALVAGIDVAIAQHQRSRPDAADFPSDKQIASWQSRLDTLHAKRATAMARVSEARAAADYQRGPALRVAKEIEGLLHSQRNLEAVVRGEQVASGWQGGVYHVA